MKLVLPMLLTFNILFFILNCGLDIEDPASPSPPQWIPKSLPEEWPERGIDAHESSGIFLEWDAKPEEDIIGYHIYRANWYELNDTIGEYDLLAKVDVESSLELNYIDREIHQLHRYYYKLKAEDVSQKLSVFSDSISYSILPPMNYSAMHPNGLTDTLRNRTFSWDYAAFIALDDFCITILTESNELLLRRIVQPSNYVGRNEFWTIPSGIEMDSNIVYKWRIDTCAEYESGRETSGSESSWATFQPAEFGQLVVIGVGN